MNATADRELRRVVGDHLRALRAEAGESQAEMARVAGISQPALSNYEAGRRDVPLSTALRLTRHYGVSLDVLVGDLS